MASAAFTTEALHGVLLSMAQAEDVSVLKQAEEQMEVWDSEPAFWEALVIIASAREADATYPPSVRQLAMTRFKNGINKYWRPRIVNHKNVVLGEERKASIRERLLSLLGEPDRIVAVQGAIAIARIARLDCPDVWPELIPALRTAITSTVASMCEAAQRGNLANTHQETCTLYQATDTLRHCIKEMYSVRISGGSRRMAELAKLLIPELQPVMEQLFAIAFETNDVAAWACTPNVAERVRASHLLLKSLHCLSLFDNGAISSRVQDVSDNIAYQFFAATPRQMAYVVQRRNELLGASGPLLEAVTKHMLEYPKLHLASIARANTHMLKWKPWSEVAAWYWGVVHDAAQDGARVSLSREDDDDSAMFPYRWLLLSMRVLKEMMDKRDAPMGLPDPVPGIPSVKYELEIVQCIISKFLPLQRADLELWQTDPEQFVIQTEQLNAETDLRPAAVELLNAMAVDTWRNHGGGHGGSYSTPFVSDYMWEQFAASAALPPTLEGVIARDALYYAMGWCRDALDPMNWLLSDSYSTLQREEAWKTRFLPESTMDGSEAWIIIRRRIAWIAWEWIDLAPEEARPDTYRLLIELLKDVPGKTDVVVRLTAARSLAAIVRTNSFVAQDFSPFLQDAMVLLVRLLTDVATEPDTIQMLAGALCGLIDAMHDYVQPYALALADLIPTLWAHDDVQKSVKTSAISFLMCIVKHCASDLDDGAQVQMQGLIAQIVRDSMAPDMTPLLGYDALLLWANMLQQSRSLSAPFMELLSFVPQLVTQPDYCMLACRVWEDTALFEPSATLQHFGAPMFAAMSHIIADPCSSAVHAPVYAIDFHLRLLSGDDLITFARIVRAAELDAAIFRTVFREDEASYVQQRCAVIVSRMAFTLPPPIFHEMVRASGIDEHPWRALCKGVIKVASCSFCSRHEKFISLGLAAMLRHATLQDLDLIECVPEILGLWNDVLGQVVEDAHGFCKTYRLEPSPARPLELEDDLPYDPSHYLSLVKRTLSSDRVEAVEKGDPSRCVPLRPYLADTLHQVLEANQPSTPLGAALHAQLREIDPLMLDMLQDGLNVRPAA